MGLSPKEEEAEVWLAPHRSARRQWCHGHWDWMGEERASWDVSVGVGMHCRRCSVLFRRRGRRWARWDAGRQQGATGEVQGGEDGNLGLGPWYLESQVHGRSRRWWGREWGNRENKESILALQLVLVALCLLGKRKGDQGDGQKCKIMRPSLGGLS